jgi:hypothetical protein
MGESLFLPNPTAGWIGEYSGFGEEDGAFGWNAAVWSRCGECGLHGVVHTLLGFEIRPCGHYPGGYIAPADDYLLKRLWAEAGNEVQWRAS